MLAAGIVAQAQQFSTLTQAGNFISSEKIPYGYGIQTTDAYISLTSYGAAIVRVRFLKNKEETGERVSFAVIAKPEQDLHLKDSSGEKLTLETDSLLITVSREPVRINFYSRRTGRLLSGDDETLGMAWNGSEVTSYRKMFSDEKFLGLGQKTGDLNHRSTTLVNWNNDAYGFKAGTQPMYSTMPFFMGIHDHCIYGIYFDNSYVSTFDFNLAGEDHNYYSFSATGGELDYYFFGAPSMSGIIRDYTHITGRMPMPPLYGLGYIQSRYSYMSEKEVLDVMRRMRESKIPCDLIFCDIDYMDSFKVFTWNKTRFPHPGQMVDSLKSMGAHLYVILDPALKIQKGYPLYEEGIRQHRFIRYPNGRPFTGSVWAGPSHFTDFLNPQTRLWWKDHLKVYTNDGITGFLNDMDEPAIFRKNAPDALLLGDKNNTVTFKEGRNVYGFEMARATYEGVKQLTGLRPFNISRSAFSGVQRFASMWTGDNEANDTHMFMDTRMSLSLSMTGLSYVGMNIGGFVGNPTPALMVRWMQLGVYMPLFINHTVGSNPHEPYAFAEPVRSELRSAIRYRYSLLPYLYAAFYQSATAGTPILKALPYGYTFDSLVYKKEYQHEFICGNSLLVVPAASTADSVKMYLPDGLWYRLSTGVGQQGPAEITVPSPADDLPVFVRSGAIIPMQTPVQFVSQPSDGILQIHIWYGKEPGRFTYYEDDGTSFDYETGNYYKREISWDPAAARITLAAKQGSFHTRFGQVKLVLHKFPGKPLSVKVNGRKILLQAAEDTRVALFANTDKQLTISVPGK
jgi:alpha-glucosidase